MYNYYMHGRHHLHIRKRIYQNLEKLPHPNSWVRLLDRTVYAVGFLGPAMTIPQIYLIFSTHNAVGVSVVSWAAYAAFDVPWVLYGLVHKEPVLVFTYSLWFVVNIIVAFGALMYGGALVI